MLLQPSAAHWLASGSVDEANGRIFMPLPWGDIAPARARGQTGSVPDAIWTWSRILAFCTVISGFNQLDCVFLGALLPGLETHPINAQGVIGGRAQKQDTSSIAQSICAEFTSFWHGYQARTPLPRITRHLDEQWNRASYSLKEAHAVEEKLQAIFKKWVKRLTAEWLRTLGAADVHAVD
eukprot:s693_g5.t1